jgi:hypothetical protein
VRDDLKDLGAWVWLPERSRPHTPPNASTPQVSRKPIWPGWLFAQLDGWQFFESRNVRHLYRTKLQLYPAEVSHLLDRKVELDAENARVEAEIEAGRRVVDYKPGDTLMVERGPFADRMSSFASVVSNARGWDLRVYIDGLDAPVRVSAADVRAAE